MKRYLFLISSIFALFSCQKEKEESKLSLWYEQPAKEWMQALPIGNGRLSAMVYGGTETEKIALNEITLWSGQPDENQELPFGKERLTELRKLFFEGKLGEGNDLADKQMSGKPNSFGTHLPMGDLNFIFTYADNKITNYKRELNLRNAISTVSYQAGNVKYTRDYFCSNPDNILVVKFSVDKKAALNFDVKLDLLRKSDILTTDNELHFSGQALFDKFGPGGVLYTGKIKVINQGGKIMIKDRILSVQNADEVTVFIDMRTNYKNPEYKEACNQTIAKATSKVYNSIKQDHINDYSRLFSRVELNLGTSEAALLPTDKRCERLKNGQVDVGLDALFFQYGRYLLIASSRENSPLPANLQGLWNDNLACNMPWTCDYHLDTNTQQNYWAANVANLDECNQPLFNYIKDLSVWGEKTAQKVYGSPGWVAHTVANVWGYTAPGEGITWGMFPTAGAWMCTHLWEHYCYTKDLDFLRNQAYPIMKKAAVFFQDYMVEHNGYLMTGPGGSPENSFMYEGRDLALSMMPTGDRILLYELYNACIESARLLNIDADFSQSLQEAVKKFPPLRISKNGEVQEWFEDYQQAHPNHRHAMHLLSVYPYNQITTDSTPELCKASLLTIENKLNSEGWEDVEFCRAQIIAFLARLKESEKAYESLNVLMTKLMRENLFTYSVGGIAGANEDIFIFDGNEAGPAAMSEMLIQSHQGYIDFLPALPKAWETGSFKGLRVKGGAEVNLEWEKSIVKQASVKAIVDNTFKIKIPTTASNLQFFINGKKETILHENNILTVNLKKDDQLEIKQMILN